MDAAKTTNKKFIQGKVLSSKMDKTIVILVTDRKLDRLYRKYVTKSKRVKVHDEKNECNVGDTVRAIETRPISKDKCWKLDSIIERAR